LPPALRVLVVDGYSAPGVKRLASVGATPAADLMQALLAKAWASAQKLGSGGSGSLEFTVLRPALLGSPDEFPSAVALIEVRARQQPASPLELCYNGELPRTHRSIF
jgi:hypothetical protein